MNFTPRGASTMVAIALLATVATQLFYIAVVSPADDALLRKITWLTEMAAFSLISVCALALVARGYMPLVWSAVALAGLVNILQVGIGLAQFGPAGEATDPKVFAGVLAGAFFLYFHGKAMLGMAALGLGFGMWRSGTRLGKLLAVLGIVSGLAAAGLGLLGMADGMAWVFPAGAAGTIATAVLAILVLARREEG